MVGGECGMERELGEARQSATDLTVKPSVATLPVAYALK
jgi:hypothetical protein